MLVKLHKSCCNLILIRTHLTGLISDICDTIPPLPLSGTTMEEAGITITLFYFVVKYIVVFFKDIYIYIYIHSNII